jgi:hypothetical protein
MAFTVGVGPAVYSAGGVANPSLVLNGTTAGRHLVIGVVWYDPNETDDDTITSITVSGESNATLISTPQFEPVTHWAVQLAYLSPLTAGGNKTVQITGTAHAASDFQIFVIEYAGPALSPWLDASGKANGSSSSPSTSFTTTVGGDLLVGFAATFDSDPTPGAGFTNIASDPDNIGPFCEGEYKLNAGAAGSKTVNWASSNNFWTAMGAGFKGDSNDGAVTFENTVGAGGPGARAAMSFENSVGAGGPGARGAVSFLNTIGDGVGLPFGNMFMELMLGQGMGGTAAAVAFEAMTAAGGPAASGAVSFLNMGARQTIAGGATFASMTALSRVGDKAFVNFELIEGFGTAHGGGYGAPVFQEMSTTGTALYPIVANGGATFEVMDAFGSPPPKGTATFAEMSAAGVGRGSALGAAVFEPMDVLNNSGAARFESMVAAGFATQNLSETYDTKATNTRLGAVTEFSNYKFNSFARIGKDYYGAGPDGLYRLDGATDNGANINWSLRTGRHDDKVTVMKRVPQVVLGLRSNGNITVRVWSDDNTFHDYPLPKVQTNTIHQHRVVPGKGMESRYFGVELRGVNNATLELDSMQIDFKHLTTRLG